MKVLILSASIGMGHIRAAEALLSAFQELGIADEVKHEDALQFANAPFRKLYQNAYFELANGAPEVLGWLYESLGKTFKNDNDGLAFERWNTGPLMKLVRDYRADVVVCTHYLPANVVSWLICKGEIDAQHAVVTTDFDIHALWLCHHYSRYFIAIDETSEHMKQLGFAADRISVSGIPVDPVFSMIKDKRAMRFKHGLPADALTMLLSAGGFGLLPMGEILHELSKLSRRTQVLAVCGFNNKLRDEMDLLSREISTPSFTIKVIGHTNQIDELMEASDLIVGKPGGLTVSEALIKGLPFVITSPIPGQELRNADYLVEEGAAIKCNNLPALAYKIERLLNDPAHFEAMHHNAMRISRPHAALDIARQIEQLAESGGQILVHPFDHSCHAPATLAHTHLRK